MHTLRARLAEYLRQRRVLRATSRVSRDVARDRAAADELQRARDGVDRFPHGGI
ncbi:hypothetical protein [Nocardioides cynanchi]|uniref:hypothetical protein n=1 Tax=Nocardioides cynanchi TaxID=2558918 RepID=UPI00177BB2E7|nr:hypothetical protein [Nocardioides cynanchi]